MALLGKTITLTADAAATLLYSYPFDAGTGYGSTQRQVIIGNTSANVIYLGGPGVTDGTNGSGAAAGNHGLHVAAAATQTVNLNPGDALYAFAHVTSIVQVMTTGS